MFGKKANRDLEGAWEEPGVIGTRIEIEGDSITVLWRNAPVLETKFKTKKVDGGLLLELKKTGMRYAGSATDYAEVTRIFCRDGALEFEEFFPISGKSSSTLKKTENSRYGNYDIADSELPLVQGEWVANEYHSFTISGDVMEMCGKKRKIRLLVSQGQVNGPIRIVDADASVYELQGLANFEFIGGGITATMLICDAPSVRLTFRRK